MWARRLRNESWDVIRESPGLKPLRLQQFLRTSEAVTPRTLAMEGSMEDER